MIFASTARQQSEANLKRLSQVYILNLSNDLEHAIMIGMDSGDFAASILIPAFGSEMRRAVLKGLNKYFKKSGFKPFVAGWDGNTYTSFGVKW